jgi:hemerythrin-like metal-binding protein
MRVGRDGRASRLDDPATQGGTMAFFVWKDHFSIGITALDRQHRGFLEMLNEYHEQVIRHGFGSISPEMLQRLKDYADTHFRDEEDLMAFKGYRELDAHRMQHRYFQKMLVDLENGRHEGYGATAEGMLAFLRDWFLSHILEVDREIVKIL